MAMAMLRHEHADSTKFVEVGLKIIREIKHMNIAQETPIKLNSLS